MTNPRLRAGDRDRIVDNAHATLARIRAYREGIATLRDAIASRMNDGIRAASYDTDSRSNTTSSPTERAALLRDGDRAHDDLTRLDALLVQLADADQGLALLLTRYPVWAGGPAAQKPGDGPCPIGRCKNCWSHKRDEQAGERWKDHCDICGRFKADHGQRMPVELWRIRVEQGKARLTTGDLRKHAPHLLKDVAS